MSNTTYDKNGRRLHDWLVTSEKSSVDYAYIQRKHRHLFFDVSGTAIINVKETSAVNLVTLCENMDIPCTLENCNDLAYKIEEIDHEPQNTRLK